MKKRFKKYAIARTFNEKLTYWPLEQFNLVSIVDCSLTNTGFHDDGYTSPDFLSFDTKEEAKKYLYRGQMNISEMIVEVEKIKFSIMKNECFSEHSLQENLTAEEWFVEWLIYNTQRSDTKVYLGERFRGRIKTIISIEGLTFENMVKDN